MRICEDLQDFGRGFMRLLERIHEDSQGFVRICKTWERICEICFGRGFTGIHEDL